MAEPGPPPDGCVYSVGHSNQSLDAFLALLKRHGVEGVADVRSAPYSRHAPHFNRPELERAVRAAGLAYVFLGRELGGRPEGDEFYDAEGHVLYGRVARAPFFQDGLRRLVEGARRRRVAMMCAEEDPAVCHRHRLVARVLTERGMPVRHLRGDGRIQTDAEVAGGPAEEQGLLFDEFREAAWRSLRPVLQKQDNPSEP